VAPASLSGTSEPVRVVAPPPIEVTTSSPVFDAPVKTLGPLPSALRSAVPAFDPNLPGMVSAPAVSSPMLPPLAPALAPAPDAGRRPGASNAAPIIE
jgi:hypothetical protein